MPHISIAGFEMTVLGYEFPELNTLPTFSYDANWLMVEARITSENGFIHLEPDACLLTTELSDFVRQLECFIQPQAHGRWQADLKPMEPWLQLHVEQEDTNLVFGAKLRVDCGETMQEFRVQWNITQEQLVRLLEQCKNLLTQFPVKV